MNANDYQVKRVERKACEEYLLHIHYAKRWPMMSHAFGLWYKDKLCGVITYGETTSAQLRMHLAGLAFETNIIELSRLCLKYNRPNEASLLVGRSIKMLPKNKIIVSFADTAQDHLGCVYQATNFLYTGLSWPHKALKLRGRENIHELGLLAEFKGQDSIRRAFKEKYKDEYYYEECSRKHRYIYFHGSRKFKKAARAALQHRIRPFPKRGETIQQLEERFANEDNIDNTDKVEQLSSSDFEDLLI